MIPARADTATVTIPTAGLPVVSFGTLLGFVIRMFFVVAGIAALMYALIGGLDWVTSQGEKEKIDAAREKITAAIIGIFVLILVLTIMWMLEQVVFNRTLCFGISCDIILPSLGDDGGTGGGGGGGGRDPRIPDTSMLIDSCPSFCQRMGLGYVDGYCQIPDVGSCQAGFERADPPHDQDKTTCYDKYFKKNPSKDEEGPCCCLK